MRGCFKPQPTPDSPQVSPAVFLCPRVLGATIHMIIVLKPGISRKEERSVIQEIRKRGYRPHIMRGIARTVIGAIGDELNHPSLEALVTAFPRLVESVTPVQKKYKLVSREARSSQPSEWLAARRSLRGRAF